MTQWATVDMSDGTENDCKGNVFRHRSAMLAGNAAQSFGYTVLCRENDDEDWMVAGGWNSPEDEARWLARHWDEGVEK